MTKSNSCPPYSPTSGHGCRLLPLRYPLMSAAHSHSGNIPSRQRPTILVSFCSLVASFPLSVRRGGEQIRVGALFLRRRESPQALSPKYPIPLDLQGFIPTHTRS